MKYFDTHTHLNSEYFEDNPLEAIERARKWNVDKMVLPGTTVIDSLSNIEFAKKYEGIYAAVGIHPSNSNEYNRDYLDEVDPTKIVAVGEVGFDFYRSGNPSYKIQKKCFEDHIKFAIENNKPVIIHMRNAEQETYDLLKKYKDLKFVLHCYSSNLDWANKFLKIGAYISISGIVTFKNSPILNEVAKSIPHDRIIAETDSPFLTPEPHRGGKNEPAYVKYVVDYLATIRNEKDFEKIIYNNSLKFFGL